VKISYKLKSIAVILISILLLVLSILLLFSHEGKMLQSRLFGKYLPTQSQIKDIYTHKHVDFIGKNSQRKEEWRVYAKVNYSLKNKNYDNNLHIKSFSSYESNEAKEFAKKYKDQYFVLDIYYNPDDPNEIILNKEDETFLIIQYGVLLLWTFLMFTLILTSIDFKEKNKQARSLKDDILKQKKAALNELQENEKLKGMKYELLNYGNHELLDLYYKGVISTQAIQEWQWHEDYARIFLMEKSIIIIFDEIGHYNILQYSFEKFLTKKDALFGSKVAEQSQKELDNLFEEIVIAIKEKTS
jgi:hypothetical protein